MISIKSNREIEIMRKAGEIVALAHKAVREAIKPGVSTLYLDEIAEKTIRSYGAIPSFKGYNGFPGSICASVNEVVIHGIPSKKIILKDGDIISIDIGAIFNGYHGDSAMTHQVGNVSDAKKKLLEVTENSLYIGLAQAKAGNRLSDISHAIEEYVLANGFSVVKEFTGHGVGRELHEDPAIPNYGEPGHGPLLRRGMTLAIEPMVNMGVEDVIILEDNWTTVTADHQPSAHFEHSIVVTDTGYEILTKLGGGQDV